MVTISISCDLAADLASCNDYFTKFPVTQRLSVMAESGDIGSLILALLVLTRYFNERFGDSKCYYLK